MPVENSEKVPINIVGSSVFGLYPKISIERTFNMFESDGWLVNYAGFKKIAEIAALGEGRGLFHSVRGGFLIGVFSSSVYRFNSDLAPSFIGNIATVTGEVQIDENLTNQICIVDGESAWIYHYTSASATFTLQTLTFLGNPIIPNYVCYHNTFFLFGSAAGSINSSNWYAFERNTDTTIVLNTQFQLQTKPDVALAVKRIPGQGNTVLVLGSTVGEVWNQVGGAQNYQRISSFNIDSGTVAVSTIAANDEYVVWVGQNENNAPSVFLTDGTSTKRISTDGIDHLLQTMTHPEESTALLYRQDGHLFYQFTFFNHSDNITLLFDITAGKFYDATDEKYNYHPARQIVYYNGVNYFVSINDASLYAMGTQYLSYDYNIASDTDDENTPSGDIIPRERICKTVRRQDGSRFRMMEFTFLIEQGVNEFFLFDASTIDCVGELITETGNNKIVTELGFTILSEAGYCVTNPFRPSVELTFSKDGNQSFSSAVRKWLNPAGQYRNQIRWQKMGQCNEWTPQLRFWGFQRFVANNGVAEII